MKCERRDLAIAKLAGDDLPSRRAHRLQQHLETCPRCKALHDDLVQRRAAGRIIFAEPSPTIVDAVLNRVEHVGPVPARWGFRRRAIAGGIAVAVLLLTAVVAITSLHARGSNPEIQTAAVASEISQAPLVLDQAPARSDVVIRLVTDNPNVAIYWLGDSAGGM